MAHSNPDIARIVGDKVAHSHQDGPVEWQASNDHVAQYLGAVQYVVVVVSQLVAELLVRAQ